jgi:outer membrane protein insertion porin family
MPLFAQNHEITDLIVKGNHFFDLEEIEDLIQTETGEPYDPRLVKLDRIRIKNFYKKNGFLDAVVRDSLIFKDRRKNIYISFTIIEGFRYYYAGIKVNGNYEIKTKSIEKKFADIPYYKALNEEKIAEAVKQVENIYYNNGKPFFKYQIKYDFKNDSTVALNMNIVENETVYIVNYQYKGLEETQPFIVRREMELKKGEIYNREALEKSQKNLYATGLFEYVRFDLEPLETDKGKVNLIITVKEKDSYWVGAQLGVAYEAEVSYGNKVEFTLQGGHRNIAGTARGLSLHLTPSFVFDFEETKMHHNDTGIKLRFVEPWIGYTRTPGIFDFSYSQYRPLNSGNFDLFEGNITVNHQYSEAIKMSANLTFQSVDPLSDKTLDLSLVNRVDLSQSEIYSMGLSWKMDSRKNLFNPWDGSYTGANLSFAISSGNHTSNKYATFTMAWQRYQPFRLFRLHREGVVFATRLRAGAIFEFEGSKSIPINDRFYLGGGSSVRGYGEQLLGPAAGYDKNGFIKSAAGGKMQFLMNAELRIPLYWLLMMEIFVDAGNVWKEVEYFSPLEVRFTSGAGLALITPLGPIRFDYGYKLTRQPQDPTPDAFHLGIYFAF